MLTRNRSLRKNTGGRLSVPRKKKTYNRASQPLYTKLGETRLQKVRARSGREKTNILTANVANVLDPNTGKAVRAKITNVYANAADTQFVRRNIITNGALIDTEAGKARVTSRPGQDGVVNAVLIKE